MNLVADWAAALPALLIVAAFAWVVATARRNVGLIDIFWSLFFVTAAAVYAQQEGLDTRGIVVLGLAVTWALRLAGYLAWRNWGAEEDRRYREIRARNEPHFAFKSLYLVFGLQALLAWLVSAPLYAAISGRNELGLLDGFGVALVLFGIGFETLADWQLARFKAQARNAGKVMDQGLWRYTRHPNYFGECCVWWGFWLIAAAAGGAWTLFAPILMTFLLLRVSGVSLLEKDIGQRRPGYREYVQRTNAFFPGPQKQT
jgi:steroid 5-alpha reductase family enzyme